MKVPAIIHTGWTKRRYLPHYDAADAVQHVVFRLQDSLPPEALRALDQAPQEARLALAEPALDRGSGSRLLADHRAATLVAKSLHHFDNHRYRLLAWCVMPTHVHVLAAQMDGWPLSKIVHGWKSFTAHSINRALDRQGTLWAREYFDRAMSGERQLNAAIDYVEYNPVKAGLCTVPGEWPWSSAFTRGKDAGETPAVR